MGRPLGSKNKNKTDGAAPKKSKAQPSPPSNVATDDQLQALTREYKVKRDEATRLEKKYKADRMNLDKLIKADLGDKGLKDIKLLEQLSSPEGEAEFKSEIERQARVARWSGLAVGTQGALFDTDRRTVEERAFDEGKRDGMSGVAMKPPHAPGTPSYDKWAEGWRAGQAAIFAIKKQPAEPEAEVIKGPDHQEASEPDDFDAAAEGAPIAKTPMWTDDVPEGATAD